ncbi:Glycosyltransferase sugar-binding region containing DXD motif-containing protein [Brevinema andersonii]|uniref:Glycosyltransferase sugar-binding region containing DXD motif-containing protein n=1 Tax=Brevinema andersonii TaxID=34097 RepID=A0A1I1EEK7_BREAD|nr:glycosyltransferase [Brevinema andersonii]SFB83768.1 Glycosyltransferase sugar-binding region containing DXD motif-containing protein [Brevinema andersonii]
MGELKVLHRIYFGFDGKPDLYQEYLETWKEQFPEYRIMHWNAENLPMDLNEYVSIHTKEKDAVFLGDYFRWWVLREYGGIYLDADIEIVNGELFNQYIEEFEQSDNHALVGIDTDARYYTAHSMACKQNSELANFMCTVYENLGPLRHWRKTFCTAPQLLSLYFMEKGKRTHELGKFTHCEAITDLAGVRIYPKAYFSPLCYYDTHTAGSSVFFLRDYNPNQTALCHHYGCSWHTEESAYFNKGQATLTQRPMLKDYFIATTQTEGSKPHKMQHILIKIWQFVLKIPHKINTLLKS